jgi:hypothetical protein
MSKKPYTDLFDAADNVWVESVTYNADGTKLVVFRGTGRRVLVPKGIRLFFPKDNFYDNLAADVEEGLNHDIHGAPTLLDIVRGKDGRQYKVLAAQDDLTVWISANGVRDQLAVIAEFQDQGTYMQEVRAAASPESLGNGVYKQVLRVLRKHFRLPLHSDDTLSPQNVLVWMSQEAKDTGSGFRINPRRKVPAAVVRAALQLAFDEVALQERIA